MRNQKQISLLIALLAAFALLAAACGSGSSADDSAADDSAADDSAADDSAADDSAADDSAVADDSAADDSAVADDSAADDGASSGGDVFRIAVVAPSAQNDLAFTQSMVDAVNEIGKTRTIEFDITDGTFIVEDAAAALRGYAEDGFDLVIAHGSQYGGPLELIAPEFPEVAFSWGTAADTFGIPNVSAYTVRADEGGYVMGTIAAQLSQSGVIGVVGPVPVGDAKLYIDGFVAGSAAQDPSVTVNVNYIESFSDVALAAEAAKAHVANNADVLTGSAQMVVGATGVAVESGVPWFGTQANQTSLGSDVVVASQVYHWEVILEELIASIEAGTLGGEVYTLTLANDGLVIEYNDGYGLDGAIKSAADATAAGVADGSITTGV